MKKLGLTRGTVKIIPYQKEWVHYFKEEEKLLRKTLKSKLINIEHVGSTSIPNMSAKPLIDIFIKISDKDWNNIEQFVEPLKELDYTYMHHFKDRKFFAKGPEVKRTHHLSFIKESDKNIWNNTLLFRDFLRKNNTARNQYKELKTKLEKQFKNDRESYTNAKEKFVLEILKKAKTK